MAIIKGRGYGLDFNVDVVMCIDATGSMKPFLNQVKENALSFYQKFIEEMEWQEPPTSVQQLRIKVIAFRNYNVDSKPMVESRFFTLDDESEEFCNFVSGIEAEGGGDGPESALEALALAMKSDWARTGSVRRHVILMCTDAPALPLGSGSDKAGYPADMPKDLAELEEWWEGKYMENRAKRLLVFAPDAEPWSDINDWLNAYHTVAKAGLGCDDVDISTSIHLLVKSI